MKHGSHFRPSASPVQGLVLGLICLGLLSAQAESLYHQTPRLTPRDRYTTPAPSPLLKWNSPTDSTDPRIHAEAPPSLDSAYVPVSMQPRENAVEKPAKAVAQDWETETNNFVAADDKPSGYADDEPEPMRGSVVAQSNSGRSKDNNVKPLVHFPEELKAAEQSAAAGQGLEPGFYPVGFRPYVPALTAVQSGQQERALLHYNRASYYGHANQLDEAIREYQKAIDENPALGDAYVGLSSAYLFKSNWQEVILNARKALTLKAGFIDPANITQARFNLSTAYCVAADHKESKRFYEMVKAANHPQSEELARYMAKNCKP